VIHIPDEVIPPTTMHNILLKDNIIFELEYKKKRVVRVRLQKKGGKSSVDSATCNTIMEIRSILISVIKLVRLKGIFPLECFYTPFESKLNNEQILKGEIAPINPYYIHLRYLEIKPV